MDLTQSRRRRHDHDQHSFEEVKELRQKHFSSRVSVSYSNSTPLMIVSGTKSRLIDHLGNTYLDTRNNVCHVGHQHPHVVQKVQEQVQTLNTNTSIPMPRCWRSDCLIFCQTPCRKSSLSILVVRRMISHFVLLSLTQMYMGSDSLYFRTIQTMHLIEVSLATFCWE